MHSFTLRWIVAGLTAALLVATAGSAQASVTWDADGATAGQADGDGAWLDANQWWNGSTNVTWTSGDDAIFGWGGTGGAVTLGIGGTTAGSLTFNSFSGTYTLGTAGNLLTLNNGLTMNSGAGAVSIVSPVTLGAAQSWLNNSTSLLTVGTDAVTNGGFLLTLGGSGNTTVSSAIGGTGGLTKIGAGSLTLSATNTYTGQTTVTAGTLTLSGAAGAIDSTAIALNGGGLTLDNSSGTGNSGARVSDSATVTVNASSALNFVNNAAAATSYAETIDTLALQSGFLTYTGSRAASGQTSGLNFNTLSRGGTATVNFAGTSLGVDARNTIKFGAGVTDGVDLGPWAVVNGADFATYDATLGVKAAANTTLAAGSNNSATNFKMTGGGVTVTASLNPSYKTLLVSDTTARTLAINGNTVSVGGISSIGQNHIISGTGAVQALAAGDALYVNVGANNTLQIASVIQNVDAGATASAVVKSGTGTLTLSSTTSNYSGGTVINAGTLTVTADTNLGASSGGITFNGGRLNIPSVNITSARTVTVAAGSGEIFVNKNNNFTTSGSLTGSATLTLLDGGGAGTLSTYNFNSTGNSFTGRLVLNNAITTVNSLADSASSIAFNSSGTFNYGTGAIAPLTLNSRAIEFNSAATNAATIQNNNTTHAITINTDLVATGAGAKTLTLGAVAGSTNVFSGDIGNGTGGGTIAVSKTGAGRWDITGNMSHTGGLTFSTASGAILNLSGTNTYSGTTVNAFSNPSGGSLVFQGLQALPTGTTLQQTHGGGVGGFGTIKLLDDAASPASRSGVDIAMLASNTSHTMSLFVGNNNTANGGTSAGTTTGSTITLGNLNFTQSASGNTSQTLSVTGTDGYGLQLNNVNLPGLLAGSTTNTITLDASSAPLTVTGNVQQAAGNAAGTMNLTLGGGAIGNLISGNILNSLDGTPKALSLTKSGTGTWTLAGTNSYTGATSVTGGLLRITGNSSAATGTITVSGGAIGGTGTIGGAVSLTTAGGINLADGAVGNLTLGSTLASTGAAGANGLTFDLANAGATVDTVTATGAFSMTTSGAGVVSVNQLGGSANRLTAGTYDILTASGGITAGGGQFRLATTKAFGQTFSLSDTTTTALKLTTTQVSAAAGNVTLTTNNGSWAAGGSFTPGNVPDYQSNVTINSAVGTTPLNGSTNINSLTFGTSATTAVTISAGTATAGTPASMLVIEAGAVNGNAAGNGITLNNTSGVHTISANIGLAANQTWTVTSGGQLDIRGVVSDFGGGYNLTKAGSGLLILGGAGTPPVHTYSGTTTINGGGIMFGSAAVPNRNLTISSGVLEQYYGNTFSRPLGSGAGQVQITGGVSGFSGQGSSASTFTITGANAGPIVWGGPHFNPTEFILQSQFANADGKGSFTSNIDLNGTDRTIRSNQTGGNLAGSGTFSGVISNSTGTAGLIKTGIGHHILSNTNTYNGSTTISQGTLTANSTGALGNSSATNTLIFNGGTLRAGAAFTSAATRGVTMTSTGIIDTNTFAVSIAGNITGAGGLIKNNTGTLTLSGTNNYSGTTTITAGTLSAAKAASLPGYSTSGKVSVAAGVTLAVQTGDGTTGWDAGQIDSLRGAATWSAPSSVLAFDTTNGNFAYGSNIGQPLTLAKLGANTLTLSGANTYTGGTAINAGTVSFTGTALSSGQISFTGNSTLQWGTATTTDLSPRLAINTGVTATLDTNGNDVAFATSFGGSGALTKAGAGNLTLSATNTFTGLTTVSAGTLTLTNNLALQNSPLVTTSAGTIDITGLTTPTFGGLSGASGNLAAVLGTPYASVTALTLNPQSGTSVTYGGVIANGSGNLPLTKTGAGTQILQGANTYTGATTINFGTLTVSGSGSLNGTTGTALAFGGTGTFNVNEAAASAQHMTSLAFNAGDGTVQSTFTATSANLTFDAAPTRAAGATGNFIVSGGTIGTSAVNANGTLGTNNIILAGQTGQAAMGVGYFAGTTSGNNYAFYDGAGFVRPLDYTNDAIPAGAATYAANQTSLASVNYAQLQNTVSVSAQATATFKGLHIVDTTANTPQAFTLASGATVTVDGILRTGNTTGAGSATTISGGTGIQASTDSEMVIRTDQANDHLTISTPILANGTNALTKSGAGTVILNGVNTYTGGTYVNAGTLQIGTNNTANGARLNSGSYAGNISIAGGATLNIQTNADQILSGIISGDGNVFKSYTGTLTLSGDNTYTGKTTIGGLTTAGGGTLSVASFNSVNGGTPLLTSSSLGAPTTVANGTIDFGSTSAQSGAQINYTGAGETTDRVINFLMNGNGAGKTLDAGSGGGLLKFTSTPTTSGSATNDITLQGTSNGEFVGGLPFVFRNFTKSGAGTWTLGGPVLNTGTIAISNSGGTLQLGNGGTGGSFGVGSAISVGTSAFFAVNQSDTVTQGIDFSSAPISGTGGFKQVGSGTTVLSLANTYTGTTAVNAGTLLVNSPGSLSAASTVTVAAAGTLGGSGTINGAVTVLGTLAPGDRSVTVVSNPLTVNNALDLSGAVATSLRLFNGTESDKLVQSTTGTLTFGGALNISQVGSWSFVEGQSWDLFDWSSMSGSFTTPLGLPNPGTGLAWDTTKLYTEGSLSIIGSGVTNGSLLTLSGTPTFGGGNRVVVGGAGAVSGVSIANAGPDASTYTGQVSGPQLTIAGNAAAGPIGASPASVAITGLSVNTATAGPVSATFSVSNDLNSGDTATPKSVTITGAVVANRTFTAAPLGNLGLRHKGESVTLSTTLTADSNDDAHATRVTIDGGTDGTLTVAGGSTIFDAAGKTDTRAVIGTFNSVGPVSGSITLSTAAASTETATGLASQSAAVTYSAQVYAGAGTWKTAGNESWGADGTNWTDSSAIVAAPSPGTTLGFANTDTATFGTVAVSSVAVSLNGISPSLKSLTFTSPTTAYTLQPGTPSSGAITLSADTGLAELAATASSHILTAEVKTAASGSDLNVTTSGNSTDHGALHLTKLTNAVGRTVNLLQSDTAAPAPALVIDSVTNGGTLVVKTSGTDANGAIVVGGIDGSAGTTIVGTSTSTATLITEHVRQDVLTINAGSKVKISATGGAASTSVVNVLNIANASGSFSWSVPGGDISPAATGGPVASGAAVPEPATWLLVGFGLLSLLALRRRR